LLIVSTSLYLPKTLKTKQLRPVGSAGKSKCAQESATGRNARCVVIPISEAADSVSKSTATSGDSRNGAGLFFNNFCCRLSGSSSIVARNVCWPNFFQK